MSGRVSVVVGTRPEAIKMAPVVRALNECSGVTTRLVCTGQHDSLLTDVLPGLGLEPDVNLRIMQPDQSLSEVGGACLSVMTEEFEAWRPDLVLVQGDTASAFFSAMAAFFCRVPVGHVEAGLRSGDVTRPFPEEGFRKLIDGLAALHFCPTDTSRTNLTREGIEGPDVHVTGNTVVDALLDIVGREIPAGNPVLASLLNEDAPPFILLTVHRRESFGRAIEEVFRAVRTVVDENPAVEVLFPVHPNPHVTEPAGRLLGDRARVHLVDPLPYPDLVLAMKGAALVLTDSGGIQEEAPTFGTPVLVLREVTDRPEGIAAGVAELVGTDASLIAARARRILAGPRPDHGRLHENPHGMGDAGRRIATAVVDFLSRGSSG